jgi:tRNA-uridine 2-sulfurtransferase
MPKMKAVSLFSGGLDSILAARLITAQGIAVDALYFKSVFWDSAIDRSKSDLLDDLASQTGAKLRIIDINKGYFDVVRNPGHGYGKNFNPCIDCKIFMLKKAKEYMEKHNAMFIVTGEVLGQRPKSQKLDLVNMIEKKAGLAGMIVRPLSAQLLEPSIPEEKGWVDRARFFAIQGRTRTSQISLAKHLGIARFPNPAGGCLLTDKSFSRRVKDFICYKKDLNENDIEILKYGRLFRLSAKTKLIAGRNEIDNARLLELKNTNDYYMYPMDLAGPIGVIMGEPKHHDIELSAGIIARYSNRQDNKAMEILFKNDTESISKKLYPSIIEDNILEKIMIR